MKLRKYNKPFCTYTSMYQDPYLQAYGKWLNGLIWSWILTVTVVDGGSIEAANKGLIDLLLYYATGARYFWVVEPDTTGRLSIQGMVTGVQAFKRLPLQDELTWRYGRSQIEPYDPTRGWCFYICKYLKRGRADIITNLTAEDMPKDIEVAND